MKKYLLLLIFFYPLSAFGHDTNPLFKDLIKAVKNKSEFSKEILSSTVVEDEKYLNFWKGGLPKVSADISGIDLNFSPPENSKKKPFTILLTFEEDNAVIRHNLASDYKTAGGLRIYPEKRDWNLFIHGAGRTSVRVAVPKVKAGVFAALICPRDFTETQSSISKSKNTRADLAYLLSGVKYDPKATMFGKIKSSLGKSLVLGEIKVSDSLPAPTRAFDFSFSKYPELGMNYSPASLLKSTPNNGAFIKVNATLHNSAGYILKHTKSSYVSVSSVNIEEGVLSQISQKQVLYRFTGGMCAAVVKWQESEIEYSKGEVPQSPQ